MKIFFSLFIIYSPIVFSQSKKRQSFKVESCRVQKSSFNCNDFINSLSSYFDIAGPKDIPNFSLVITENLNSDDNTKDIINIFIKGDKEKLIVFEFLNNQSQDLVNIKAVELIRNEFYKLYPELPIQKEKLWTHAPTIFLSSGQGQTSSNSYGSLGYNTSRITKINRLSFEFYTNYSNQRSNATATTIESQIINSTLDLEINYIHNILNKHFHAYIKADHFRKRFKHSETELLTLNEQNNLASRNRILIGLEWIKEPFLTETKTNYSVRLSVAPTFHNYLDPEIKEQVFEDYLIGKTSFQLERYDTKNNIYKISLNGAIDLKGSGDSSLGIKITPNFRVLKNLTLAPNFNLFYRRDVILSAADGGGNYLSQTGASKDSFFSYYVNLQITYEINPNLSDKDRRWR